MQGLLRLSHDLSKRLQSFKRATSVGQRIANFTAKTLISLRFADSIINESN